MSIWILAFVLCAIFATIGFFSGAIRTAMLWLGVLMASFLTGAIAPKLKGLMPKIGIVHPLWVQVAPYLIVSALIALVVYGIGFGIHHKIALIYKYQRDDFSRVKWERMNSHVGISIGLVIAVMVFFSIAKVAYAGGYLTAQVSEDSNNPPWIQFLTAARTDMQSTGLDKALAALDKTPEQFYDASDVIGLIYHNPAVQTRLANYPPLLQLGQRAEFQEVSTDKEYNDLLFGKSSFGAILNHPNTQRFLGNREILEEFQKLDLKDLKHYLETGKSKFDDEKLLGRWILDKDATLTQVRKSRPDIKGNDLIAVKNGLARLPDMTVVAMLDGKAVVKTEGGAPAADPNAATPPPQPPPQPINRPGQIRGPSGPRGPQPVGNRPPAVKAPVVAAAPVLRIGGEGEWKPGATGGYDLTLQDAGGKQVKLVASIEGDQLTVSKDNLTLIFDKAE